MRVADLLEAKQQRLIVAAPETSLSRAMEMMIYYKISCLPVIEQPDELIGLVSDKDIFRHIHEHPGSWRQSKIGELMSVDLIVGVAEDELSYMAGIMTTNRVRHVPIVDGNRLVGLISVGDIVKTQMQSMEIENRYLRQFIDGTYPG